MRCHQVPKTNAALAKGTFTLKGIDEFLGWETSVSGAFIFRLQEINGQWTDDKAYILRS
jgi:hypothetical protein